VHAKVVGISEGGPRQMIALTCECGQRLRLERDQTDAYSRNTILILRLDGRQLGFVSEELAEELAPAMDYGCELMATVTKVTGGSEIGVHILIDEAERIRGDDLSFLDDGQAQRIERRRTRYVNRSFIGAISRSLRRLFRE
jgi:hypothetical protein